MTTRTAKAEKAKPEQALTEPSDAPAVAKASAPKAKTAAAKGAKSKPKAKPADKPAAKSVKAKKSEAPVEAAPVDEPANDVEDAAEGKKGARKATLLIVESPAKAKTIQKYLGRSYIVLASKGHIKDLPKRGGVDMENGFREEYVVIEEKGKHETLHEIQRAARK